MTMTHLRRRVLLSLAVALTAATAACSGAATPTAPSVSANPPEPAGVLVGKAALAGSSGGTASQSCDPTASLAPVGALPSPGHMPSGSTMARIQARGELIAGIDQNTYLFGYRDPKSGQIEGFDIDMIHQVAQAIFGNPNKVRFVVINNANRVQELQQGKVDIVADTMTENCARWQQVDFSTTYFEAHQRVLVEDNSPYTSLSGLGGKKVCAAAGSDSLQTIADTPSHPIPVSAVSFTDCLVMLQQGQVSAVSTDDAILAGLARQDPNVKVVGADLTQEPYGLAMSKQSTDFVRFVNGVLAQMRADGTWTSIYNHWLAATLGPASPPAAHYKD